MKKKPTKKKRIPIEYEQVIKSLLASSRTLDDARYWTEKVEALAAWERIYRSSDVKRKAAHLNLYAYRRMAELAAELRQPLRRPVFWQLPPPRKP